jgi:hypothetical protein
MNYISYKLESPLGFGKYKGRIIKEIIEKDIGYISWCLINVERFVIEPEVEDYAKELQDKGGRFPLDMYALMKLDEKNINISNGAYCIQAT